MRHAAALTITSLLPMLLATFHLADDIVRGFSPGGLLNFAAILFLVLWLYATIVLPERRSGLAIILLGSLPSSSLPVIHMTGERHGRRPNRRNSWAFFFAWTLIAVGVTANFSVILATQGLWNLHQGRLRT
jgi:hypothetical protein